MNHLNKSYFAYHMPYLKYDDGHWCLCYKLYPDLPAPSPEPVPVPEPMPVPESAYDSLGICTTP